MNDQGFCQEHQCDVAGCQRCAKGDPSQCRQCYPGYMFGVNGSCTCNGEEGEKVCIPCQIYGCLKCVEGNSTVCEECWPGVILSEDGHCNCGISRCNSCQDEEQICRGCVSPFSLSFGYCVCPPLHYSYELECICGYGYVPSSVTACRANTPGS